MVAVKNRLTRIVELGFLPTDDDDLRLKKVAVILVPLIIGPFAFVWGSIYFLLGHLLSGSIPMSYAMISAVSLIYFFKTKKIQFIQYSQLILVLMLPFLLMWSLGGFSAGSMVMIWAIFSPIAALMFLENRPALIWFLMYFVLILISVLIDDFVAATVTPLPNLARHIFYLLNLGCGSAGLYLLVSYSIGEEKRAIEDLKSERLRLEERSADLNRANQALNAEIIERETVQKYLIKANDIANAANRAKSEFLASMSHELRTPLNVVLGYSQLLCMDPNILESTKDQAREIENAGQHLLALINDMIDLARIEAGKLELSMEPVLVKSVIADALKMVTPLAGRHGIELFDVGTRGQDEIVVHADNIRLRQVLINLLSNAIKYNRPLGSVRLSCQASNRIVRISVADTGPGIPADKQSRIFSAFDRLGKESGTVEGTGIGLIITKRIVEAMGGSIGFESTAGQGSTFWVELRSSDQSPVKLI